jgi:hypothetical protein
MNGAAKDTAGCRDVTTSHSRQPVMTITMPAFKMADRRTGGDRRGRLEKCPSASRPKARYQPTWDCARSWRTIAARGAAAARDAARATDVTSSCSCRIADHKCEKCKGGSLCISQHSGSGTPDILRGTSASSLRRAEPPTVFPLTECRGRASERKASEANR